MGEPSHSIVFSQLMKITIVCSSLHLLPALWISQSVPQALFVHSVGRRALFRERRGASVCLEGLSPPPPRVSFAAKLLGILAWVGCWGAQIAATTGWQPGARLFKSACSTRARSLFGNFCRGVKRAAKSCKAVWAFFLFLFLFVIPVLGLHASPGFTQNLRVPKRWWLSGRPEVLGSGFGEVWVFTVFFFFLSLDFNIFPISWQPPTPLTCSAAAAQLAAEAWRGVGVRFRF